MQLRMTHITRRQKAIRKALEHMKDVLPNPQQGDQTLHHFKFTGGQVFAMLPLLEQFLSESADPEFVHSTDAEETNSANPMAQ